MLYFPFLKIKNHLNNSESGKGLISKNIASTDLTSKNNSEFQLMSLNLISRIRHYVYSTDSEFNLKELYSKFNFSVL